MGERLGVGEVSGDVLGSGADDDEPGGDVLDQCLEGAQQDRQALPLLGPADE